MTNGPQSSVAKRTLDNGRRSLVHRVLDAIFGFDFFVSYTRRDGTNYAEALARSLERVGFQVFLDSDDYAAGDDWKVEGKWALRRTSQLIVVASPEALSASSVVREVEIYSSFPKRRIIPIDFGGTIRNRDETKPIFKSLRSEILFIEESPDCLGSKPSDFVVRRLRDGFNLRRQDQKRVRWFAGLSAVFAAVAIVAIIFFFIAKAQTTLATKREAEVRSQSSHSDLLTAGRLQNEDRADEAVAYLTRAIRTDPSNQLAKDKLVATLALTGFVPVLEQYRDAKTFGARTRGAGFEYLAFNQNGSELLICDNTYKSDRTLACWDINSRTEPIYAPVAAFRASDRFAVSPAGSQFLIGEANKGYLDVYKTPDPKHPLVQEYAKAASALKTQDDLVNLGDTESNNAQAESAEKELQSADEKLKNYLKVARIEVRERTPVRSHPPDWHKDDSGPYLLDNMMNQRGEIVLASGHAAQVWSIETARAISPLFTMDGSAQSEAISADGSTVVVGDSDWKVHVWRAPDWKKVGTYQATYQGSKKTEGRDFGLVATNVDGSVVAGSVNKFVSVWDVRDGEVLDQFNVPYPLEWMRVNRDGSAIITRCRSGHDWGPSEADLWPLRGHWPLRDFFGFEHSFLDVSAIAMDSRGEQFVTTSGRTAQIRDAVNGNSLSAVLKAPGKVQSVAFSPNGARVALGTENGFVGVWDWSRAVTSAPRWSLSGNSTDFKWDGKFAAAASRREVIVINVETGQELRLSHPDDVRLVRLARNGSVLAAAVGKAIYLWNPATGKQIADPLIVFTGEETNFGPPEDFVEVTLSDDGSHMVVVRNVENGTTVWDLRKQPPVGRSIKNELGMDGTSGPLAVQVNEGGTRAMFGSTTKYDADVSVFDLETGKQLITQQGKSTADDAPKLHGELSADGKKMALRENNSIRLLEIDNGRETIKPILLDSTVTAVAFGRRGSVFLTGTKDGTAMIWDASSGQALSQPMLHQGGIDAIAMSDDGTRVVTATSERAVRIWDVKSGEALTPPISCPGSRLTTIISVGFSFHDSTVFARSISASVGMEVHGSLSLWEIPSWGKEEVPEWFLKMAEAIGGRRLDERGNLSSVPVEESKENRRSEFTRKGDDTGAKWARKLLAPKTKNEAQQQATPAPTSSPEIPIVTDDPAEVSAFVDDWMAAGSSGTHVPRPQTDFYTDPAQINGKAKTRTELIADQQKFEEDFPVRVFNYMGHEIVTTGSDHSTTVHVHQHVVLRNPRRVEHQTEIVDELVLRRAAGELKIESIKRISTKKIR